MKYFDEELCRLQEQVTKKVHYESVLKNLYDQQRELQDKVRGLAQICRSENQDVEKLEGFSLAALYYFVIGKKDEMLDKERAEAYAAQVKHDAAQAELDSVAEEITKARETLLSLSGCEKEYEKIKEEKKAALKQSGSPEAEKIMQIEEEIAGLENRLKEITEAQAAGSEALRLAERIVTSLDKAEGWGTWDVLGGGLVSDIAKHSHLNEAQRNVEELQIKLRKYRTELEDVTVEAEIEVGIGGFLNFADYFFDGLLADWMVLSKITKSKGQAETTGKKISMMQFKLNELKQSVERECEKKRAELDALVLNTKD